MKHQYSKGTEILYCTELSNVVLRSKIVGQVKAKWSNNPQYKVANYAYAINVDQIIMVVGTPSQEEPTTPEPKFKVGQIVIIDEGLAFEQEVKITSMDYDIAGTGWWYAWRSTTSTSFGRTSEDRLSSASIPTTTTALTYANGEEVRRDDVVSFDDPNSLTMNTGRVVCITPGALLVLYIFNETYSDVVKWYNVNELDLIRRADGTSAQGGN